MEGKSSQTIGVMGAGPGCGVTHFTLLFANYLAGVELKRTAVMEWKGNHGLKELTALCSGKEPEEKPISILEVDYFPEGGARELAWCMQKGYDYVLLDFGGMEEEGRGEFLQCGQKFFLGALNEWKIKELLRWKDWMLQGKGKWIFLAFSGSREARKEMERRFGLLFQPIPYSPDVFSVEREIMLFFKRIWKENR